MKYYLDLYNGNPFDDETEMLTFGPVAEGCLGDMIESLMYGVAVVPGEKPRVLVRFCPGG